MFSSTLGLVQVSDKIACCLLPELPLSGVFAREVATENFHDLHARLISNENVKFAMFKDKARSCPWAHY